VSASGSGACAKPRPKPKQKVVLPPPDPQVFETTLEDLDSDEEDEHYIERPPAMIRNGPGGYDVDNDFSPEDDDRKTLEKHINKNNKGTALMAAAMAMQNERD